MYVGNATLHAKIHAVRVHVVRLLLSIPWHETPDLTTPTRWRQAPTRYDAWNSSEIASHIVDEWDRWMQMN